MDIWALWLSNGLSAALAAFSVLLRPTTAAQPLASSWPLLAHAVLIVRRFPRPQKIEIGQRGPSSPLNPQTGTGDIKFSLSYSHHRVMARGASAVLAGFPTARPFLPSVQSPTAGPPAHTRTATLAVLSLECRLPSAVSTFGPDEFRPRLGSPAVSFARLP